MAIYVINIIFFLIYSTLFFFLKNKRESLYSWVVILHLSIFMGLRSYSVGTDTSQYVEYYLTGNSTFNSNGALVYRLFSKIVMYVSNSNYHIFLLLLAFLTVYLFVMGIREFDLPDVSLFFSIYIYISFYFFFDSFNIQRQMLAVSITFFAAGLMSKEKYFSSIVAVLIATGVHSTALVMFLIFPFWFWKKSKFRLVLISLFALLINSFLLDILNVFSRFFGHYDMYTSSITNDLLSSNGGSLFLGIFILVFLLLGVTLTDMLTYRDSGFVTTMMLVGGVLLVIGMKSQLIIRIAEYFSIYMTIFIPLVTGKIAKRFRESGFVLGLLILIVVLAGSAVCFYKLSHNIGEIIPYLS